MENLNIQQWRNILSLFVSTFGYESSFDIADGISGHIKQEGIKFSF